MLDNNVYCSKNYYFERYHKTLFFTGKLYEYYFEDLDTIWVTYDDNGDEGFQGCRFYIIHQRGELQKFSDYFDLKELRRKKLEKLKLASGE